MYGETIVVRSRKMTRSRWDRYILRLKFRSDPILNRVGFFKHFNFFKFFIRNAFSNARATAAITPNTRARIVKVQTFRFDNLAKTADKYQ